MSTRVEDDDVFAQVFVTLDGEVSLRIFRYYLSIKFLIITFLVCFFRIKFIAVVWYLYNYIMKFFPCFYNVYGYLCDVVNHKEFFYVWFGFLNLFFYIWVHCCIYYEDILSKKKWYSILKTPVCIKVTLQFWFFFITFFLDYFDFALYNVIIVGNCMLYRSVVVLNVSIYLMIILINLLYIYSNF